MLIRELNGEDKEYSNPILVSGTKEREAREVPPQFPWPKRFPTLDSPQEESQGGRKQPDFEQKPNYQFPKAGPKMDTETTKPAQFSSDFFSKVRSFGQSFGAKHKAAPVPGIPDWKPTETLPPSLDKEFKAVNTLLISGSKQRPVSDLSESIKADLGEILKKSTETSALKAKVVDAKLDLDRILLSGRKQPILMDSEAPKPLEQPQPQNAVSLPALPPPEQRKVKSRRSQGLLEFLGHNSFNDDSVFEDEKSPKSDKNDGMVINSTIDVERPVIDQFESQKKEKPEDSDRQEIQNSIERLDFENDKRSRKSHFPEKLSRRLLRMDGERDSQDAGEIDSMAERLKGPFFEIYSSSAASTRFAEFFTRLNTDQEDESPSLSMRTGLFQTIQQKKSWIKSLDVESMTNFEETLLKDITENEAILAISPDQLSNINQIEGFDEMLKLVVKHKLLACLNFCSRIDILNKIDAEIDAKLKEVETESATLASIGLKEDNNNTSMSEEELFNLVVNRFDVQYFRKSSFKDTKNFEITFALQDMLFFSLFFEHRLDDRGVEYLSRRGYCRSSPIIGIAGTKANNPLNNPQLLANIISRFLTTACSDGNQIEALNLFTYVCYFFERLEGIRKSLNQCISRHKISDVVVDIPRHSIQFLIFPKLARVKFSLKITVGLLPADKSDVGWGILSSSYKKKNTKTETFYDLEEQLREILHSVDSSYPSWLASTIDKVAEIINDPQTQNN